MTTPVAVATPKAAPQPSRMTLGALVKGKQEKPVRLLVYGVEGVGKSTLAANAPDAVFLGVEDGTSHLDAVRFPTPATWTEVLDAIRELTQAAHQFKTLAIDTLDWLEPLLWAHICARDGKASIEDYGYGKGYQAALDEWRIFLAALERLRVAKGMHVILLAHSWIKPFKNPEGSDFDRYELKLNVKAGGLLKEWSDVVLFANFETFAHKDEKTKRVRGVSDGSRVLYTQRTAAYDAKNRFDLPDRLPLSWDDLYAAMRAHRPADPAKLVAEVERKAKLLGGEIEAFAVDYLKRHPGDAAALAKINDRLTTKLAEREEGN